MNKKQLKIHLVSLLHKQTKYILNDDNDREELILKVLHKLKKNYTH